MKCAACGYDKSYWILVTNDKGVNYYENIPKTKKTQTIGIEPKQINLFACPKCGTVRIEVEK